MPRTAYYSSFKALVVSWFVFFGATLSQILLPWQTLKKISFLSAIVPDSLVAAHLKLAASIFSNNMTILDRVIIALTNASSGFVGSIREIFIIIFVCNLTIFRDDKYPLVSLFLILLRRVLKFVDLDEYFMGIDRPSLSLFGGEALESPLLSIGAAVVRKVLQLMDLDEYFLGRDDRPSLSLFGGDHEEEMPALEFCEVASSDNLSKNNDDYGDYGFDFESEFQRRHSQNSKEDSPTSSPNRRGIREGQLSPMNASEPKEWYVFDNVYGVIPSETRELWQQQEAESLRSREQSPIRKKKVVPVRFHGQSEESTSNGEPASEKINDSSDNSQLDHPVGLADGASRSLF